MALVRTMACGFLPGVECRPFLFPGNARSRRHSASAERGPDPVGDVFGGGSVSWRAREIALGPSASRSVGRCAGGIFRPNDRRAEERPRRLYEASPEHQTLQETLLAATIQSSNSRSSFPGSDGGAMVSSRDLTTSSASSRWSVRPLHGSLPKVPSFSVSAVSPKAFPGDLGLLPQTSAGASLVVSNVIVGGRPGWPRDSAGGSRHLQFRTQCDGPPHRSR